ncbi:MULTISPECIES: LytR C-terminal domain-containing protein [unclassified Janthinobacterium]|uniref:LytR C-terminal domain-containing protein n=1 Tax=unclassified Janthinobacterium TaxID=2610881 RepID=UPI00160A2D62|nr:MULTISPECIES: LytR C-terminal domain-containing protein [unclassified Janthinobacterium]MBB5605699.1 tetratricopeptide (TPR) repeat protein [Janthinobacterium sp. S3T4]MBB5611382.1 tetratricopeptide (TPR) repeat protein [Janthinobacterium sp. S3M3]
MHPSLSRMAAACACLSLGACASSAVHAPSVQMPDIAGADVAYAAGRRHFDAGDLLAAQASYTLAMRSAPDHVDAHNGLAVLHAQRGDLGAAIGVWQAVTGMEGLRQPQYAYVFANLGHAYALAGRHADALPMLEQACLLAPLNARHWQQLAQVLLQLGQQERAELMLAQAQSLQAHDARSDYALLQQHTAPAAEESVARVEITQTDGLARLQRVPARQAAAPSTAPAQAPVLAVPLRPRLEILNGNGVHGMAAAMARSLAASPLQVVRLGNEPPYQVLRTRVEYRPAQEQTARLLAMQLGPQVDVIAADVAASDLRLILGRDFSDPAMLHRYYLQQLQLARKALAQLG